MSVVFYAIFAKWASSTEIRAIMAALFAFAFVFFLCPYTIRKLKEYKAGQPIREGYLLEELHKNKRNIPTMGGILIIFSVLFAALFWMDLTASVSWMLLTTLIVFACIGAYDDLLKLRQKKSRGLSGKRKFFAQVVWALVIILYVQMPGISEKITQKPYKGPTIEQFHAKPRIKTRTEYAKELFLPFFKKPIVQISGVGLLLLWAFYIFVIVGSSNAVNLTDGLDGLAAGISFLVASVLGLFAYLSSVKYFAEAYTFAYIEQASEIAVFCAALAGACLGFLWYNCMPAKLFMGDTGSLALGGAFGTVSILFNHPFLLGLVGAIFVIETLSVIIQVVSFRYRRKRVFLCSPIHHHFEYKGWPENRVVVRFWIVGLFLAFLGILSFFIGIDML